MSFLTHKKSKFGLPKVANAPKRIRKPATPMGPKEEPTPRPLANKEYRLLNCVALAAKVVGTRAARAWASRYAKAAAKHDDLMEEQSNG
jgi:hypothetical protein